MKRILLLSLLFAAPIALAVDVEGYVYTIEGTPVSKASVTAGTQRATTDDDGHFAVTAPADSIVAIDVRAENLPPAKVLALAGDPPLTITLAPAARDRGAFMTTAVAPAARASRANAPAGTRDRVITGLVRVGKRPLVNAPVTIQRISEFYEPPVTVTSDDKGRYRLAVGPGRFTVIPGEGLAPRLRSINEDRMQMDGENAFLVDTTKAKETVLDVELVAAPLASGRAVDADGKPVARADVLVVLAGRSPLEFFHQPIVRTRPDGRFDVPVPPFEPNARTEIVVMPPRHSPVRSKPMATITLPKFETVTVRVIDREKKPIANATLTLATADETASFGSTEVLLMPHLMRRRVNTNADGSVELHLAKGDYDLAAVAPKHQPRTVSHRVTGAGSLDITLEPGFTIRGIVHRGEQPVPNVQVVIRGGNVPRGERSATTDEKGAFLFDALPRGTYSLGFFKSDELIEKTLNVDAPGEVDLALPLAGTLRGRVIDADRNPVAQFIYTLEPLDGEQEERRMRGMSQRGESSADGTFNAVVPVGRYRLTAASNGFLPSDPLEIEVTQNDSAPVEIVLPRGAVINGRVTDEEGRPVADAHVMIAGDVGAIQRSARPIGRMTASNATTAADGSFTLTGVETGPAQLIVRRTGFVLERVAIDVEPETRVDVTMKRGLSLSGVVTLNGKPIGGVEVGASTSAVSSDYASTTTDERGRFTLEGLVPARYLISANKDNHHAQIKDVDAAQRRELVIELEGKGRGVVYGTVTGVPRTNTRGTRGSVYVQGGEEASEGTIDADGNFRVENAPAGAVDVVANIESPQGTRAGTRKRIELAPGQSLRVDLDLTPAIVVTGRVTHGGSKAVTRAQVVFSNDTLGMSSAATRDDGTYEIGLSAPGRYHIFVNAEELMSRAYQTVHEIRSSETFDIQLAEQTIEGTVVDAATRQPLQAIVTLVPKGSDRNVSGETIADASGRFSIITAAAGPHVLIASAPGYAHRAIDLTLGGGDPVRAQFDLTPVGELRIRILDARNGTPLDAHVTIADERGVFLPLRPTRTPDGTELVFSVAPGKYRVTAVTPGYREKTVEVNAPGAGVVGLE